MQAGEETTIASVCSASPKGRRGLDSAAPGSTMEAIPHTALPRSSGDALGVRLLASGEYLPRLIAVPRVVLVHHPGISF
jgi:hypothetical protein